MLYVKTGLRDLSEFSLFLASLQDVRRFKTVLLRSAIVGEQKTMGKRMDESYLWDVKYS